MLVIFAKKGLAVIRVIPQRLRANVVLLVVTVIWGATFSLTKAALAVVPVFPYLGMRFLLATGLMLMIALVRVRSRQHLRRAKLWGIGSALGVLLFAGYALQTLGLKTVAPAVSAFLTGFNVILVPLIAIPLLGHGASRRTWLGAGMALLGLAVLNGVESVGHWSAGSLFTLACAVFLALQIVYVDKWSPGLDSIALTTVELAVVTILSLLFSFVHGSFALPPLSDWQKPAVVAAVVVNGVFGTAFAYWAQTRYQQMTSASYVAVIFTMEPVFAAMIAVLFFHEPLTASLVVGGFMIVLSMLLADESLPAASPT